MLIFPKPHQIVRAKNSSRLHSMWVALWVCLILLVKSTVWDLFIKATLRTALGILGGMVWNLHLMSKTLGFGVFGWLDAQAITREERLMQDRKRMFDWAMSRLEAGEKLPGMED